MDNAQVNSLVRRAAKGDESAFVLLVERYQTLVYQTVLSFLHNREDALDASQEIFIKVYRFLPTFQFESSFSTWLYRISKNTAIDILRASQRRAVASTEVLSAEGIFLCDPDSSADPEARAIASDHADRLHRAIGQLSEHHREVILLSSFCGESYESIAEKLGIEIGTVKSRINRAKHELRKLLEGGNFFV